MSQSLQALALIAVVSLRLAKFVPFAVLSITPLESPSRTMKLFPSMLKQPQTGRLIFAPDCHWIVIGCPADPDACTVSFDVIVPHNPTVTPGAKVFVEPQFVAVLKNVADLAFAHDDPSPVPPVDCATNTDADDPPPPPGHAAVVTGTDAVAETLPAPSTAATPSV